MGEPKKERISSRSEEAQPVKRNTGDKEDSRYSKADKELRESKHRKEEKPKFSKDEKHGGATHDEKRSSKVKEDKTSRQDSKAHNVKESVKRADDSNTVNEIINEIKVLDTTETGALPTEEIQKMDRSKAPSLRVNRDETCPFLLRVFPKYNNHHRIESYQHGKVPEDLELNMHTWMDASLKELGTLIKSIEPESRRKHTRINFSCVYPTARGHMMMKEIGTIIVGRRTPDDNLKLLETRFRIGDYLDVCIETPQLQSRYLY
ncbi:uncharacterized protein LOC135143587 [Zophobas morio]|uniref:uncharacterized protein LOC135143587 n=1 Tax=Zophobas morio TaxID=2755281 RepID=UPI00308385E5